MRQLCVRVRRSSVSLLAVIAVLQFGLHATPALAQNDQKRPIRLLVPSSPGGPSDFAARLKADWGDRILNETEVKAMRDAERAGDRG